jgi:hypothetical protein
VIRHAIERTQLQSQILTLALRQLLATDRRAGALPGETALQTLDGVLARGEVVAMRNDEAAASLRDVPGKPDVVTAVRVGEQKMVAVAYGDARQNWTEIVEADYVCCGERLRDRCNDNNGR